MLSLCGCFWRLFFATLHWPMLCFSIVYEQQSIDCIQMWIADEGTGVLSSNASTFITMQHFFWCCMLQTHRSSACLRMIKGMVVMRLRCRAIILIENMFNWFEKNIPLVSAPPSFKILRGWDYWLSIRVGICGRKSAHRTSNEHPWFYSPASEGLN